MGSESDELAFGGPEETVILSEGGREGGRDECIRRGACGRVEGCLWSDKRDETGGREGKKEGGREGGSGKPSLSGTQGEE